MTSDVTLTAAINGYDGLPPITSAITIAGGGFTIVRDPSAPEFRILNVASSGDLTLNNTTISGGQTSSFGGISNFGTVIVNNSTISSNTADGGGGVFNRGTLTVNNSTLSGNTAGNGGGVYNINTATVSNSTLSGNTANSEGGGIYNSSTLMVSNSTLSGNAAYSGGGISNFAVLTLNRSLISGNTATGGSEIIDHTGLSVSDFNLFGHDGDAGIFGFTPSGSDIVPSQALAAILGPLANNGGGTLTHALVAGSPAIDAAGATGPATDQRGVSRPQGTAFDIGAFEVRSLNSSVTQVSVNARAYNSTLVACGAGVNLPTQTVTPLLHNNTSTSFTGLFFKVKTLEYKVTPTNGQQPRLCNSDTPGGGVGTTLTSASSLAANSDLTPAPNFQIGLPTRAAYRFFVELYSSSASAANADGTLAADYLGSFEYEVDANGQIVGQHALFLPLVQR